MSDYWKKPAICWHSDPDEAFLVGTKESFIELAELLLKLAESKPTTTSDISGVELFQVSSEEYLTEHGLDIVLQNITLVHKQEDVGKVINHFRVLNGELPLTDD